MFFRLLSNHRQVCCGWMPLRINIKRKIKPTLIKLWFMPYKLGNNKNIIANTTTKHHGNALNQYSLISIYFSNNFNADKCLVKKKECMFTSL